MKYNANQIDINNTENRILKKIYLHNILNTIVKFNKIIN